MAQPSYAPLELRTVFSAICMRIGARYVIGSHVRLVYAV